MDKKYHMNLRTYIGGLLTGILVTVLAGGLIAAGLYGNGMIKSPVSGGSADSAVNDASVKKLRGLEKMIEDDYYSSDEVTVSEKEDGLYKGLIDSLGDVYSEYYTADEWQSLNQQTEGVYYGIGAYVTTDQQTGYPVISSVMDGSSAEDAGILAGDIIYKVDGTDVQGLSLEEVVSKIKGEEGTVVHLTLVRDGSEVETDVTRKKFDAETVVSRMLEGKIGYIGITEFDTVTSSQFEKAKKDLEDQGMEGLIIDLRGNPGGNVSTVTAIAEQLLPKGLIFYYQDKNGKRTDYTATGSHELKIPLAVLVNGYSASASEILSGAVQDSGIGTIVGTQTYGKGVVQSVYDLNDGTAVKLTTAEYFTRNGRNINHKGITPDVEVELDTDAYKKDGTDNQLEKAESVITDKMKDKAEEK